MLSNLLANEQMIEKHNVQSGKELENTLNDWKDE
jgi:hypothetical protein